ncbi:hypothetical protein [Burkholderia cepacia]|uniref:hypothetical protein n=1 Tax=Burkholderia cepacia TaxID=292 RepID=UPI000A703A25|nr:hypothetical protein [Burkholderia cepacia]
MREALHPTENRPITVVEYIQLFGPRLNHLGIPNIRPAARCPACNEKMYPRGEANPIVDGVFYHKPNSTAYCPLKQSAAQPYKILPPKNPDLVAAQKLRSSFFSHWKFHWKLIRDYAPFADIGEFIALIHYADSRHLWQYQNIQEFEVPYIFLVLKDFPPIKSKGKWLRREWMRFWFDARVRTIDDLWIRTTGDWRIVKAIYAVPRAKGTIPGAAQLKSTAIPPVKTDFLDGPEPTVHPYQEASMKEAFPDELSS